MLDLCMNCMERLSNNEDICRKCHESRNSIQPESFLPKKKIIGNRYIVGKGIKKDFEGLGYIGYDFIKNSKVYIREFFPSEICERTNEGEVIVNNFSGSQENFNIIRKEFLKYFRAIARLRNLDSFAAVYDILEENQTVYIIFEWIEGHSLDKYLSIQGGSLDWKQARTLFMPLLSSLSKMHFAGIKHLGIAPCNMIVTDENKIKLSGFATRFLRTNNNIQTSQLYDGCSALEQYIPGLQVSETTDVYGFTASLFFALTGEFPLSAINRNKKDRLMMTSNVMNELPETVISAIANALRVQPNSRTISFETLRVELSNSPILQVKNIYDKPEEFNIPSYEPQVSQKSSNTLGIVSCIISLIVLITSLTIYWFWIKEKNSNSPVSSVEESNPIQNLINQEEEENKEEEKIEVPQLIGKSLSEAEKNSNSENSYKVVVISEEFHETIPEGNIISQNPSYGGKMYSGSIIAVNVSKGPSKRALPDIAGKSLSEVSILLTDAKFIPSQVSENSSEVAQGLVIGYQDYKAGDMLDCGSEVVIVVSKG